MYCGAASDYLLAVSVSTLGDCTVVARLTFADVLRFAMTAEKTWHLARLPRSTRVLVVAPGKPRIRLVLDRSSDGGASVEGYSKIYIP